MSSERDAYPSAELFVELQKLGYNPPSKQRSARAWQLIGRAYGHNDSYLLLDFALEHGLINSCDETGKPLARRGQATHHFVWINPVDGSEMVWIPAGPFFVGPKQKNQHAQSKGFSLARHPVTNGQFAQFLEETGYTPPPGHPDPDRFLSHWRGATVSEQLERHPVVWVSYLDALAYCDWGRLDTPDGMALGEGSPRPGRTGVPLGRPVAHPGVQRTPNPG